MAGSAVGRGLPAPELSGAVRAADVRRYASETGSPVGRRFVTTAVILLIYLVGQSVLVTVYVGALAPDGPVWRIVPAVWILLTGLYAVGLVLLLRRSIVRSVRMWRMAGALGIRYRDHAAVPVTTGTGARSRVWAGADVVTAEPGDGRAAFIAATIPRSTGPVSRRAGILVVPLGRAVPRMVLENRRVRVLRARGARPVGAQRLRLEGDFDRTFQLFCAAGYERDALYIFTPDLMSLLLDVAGECEMEFRDEAAVLYARRPWRLWRPERFAAVVSLASTVAEATQRRVQLYRDERAEVEGTIAASGRSLRMRPTAGTVLTIVTMCAITVLGALSALLRW